MKNYLVCRNMQCRASVEAPENAISATCPQCGHVATDGNHVFCYCHSCKKETVQHRKSYRFGSDFTCTVCGSVDETMQRAPSTGLPVRQLPFEDDSSW